MSTLCIIIQASVLSSAPQRPSQAAPNSASRAFRFARPLALDFSRFLLSTFAPPHELILPFARHSLITQELAFPSLHLTAITFRLALLTFRSQLASHSLFLSPQIKLSRDLAHDT